MSLELMNIKNFKKWIIYIFYLNIHTKLFKELKKNKNDYQYCGGQLIP